MIQTPQVDEAKASLFRSVKSLSRPQASGELEFSFKEGVLQPTHRVSIHSTIPHSGRPYDSVSDQSRINSNVTKLQAILSPIESEKVFAKVTVRFLDGRFQDLHSVSMTYSPDSDRETARTKSHPRASLDRLLPTCIHSSHSPVGGGD
jgi:hypothetical protein